MGHFKRLTKEVKEEIKELEIQGFIKSEEEKLAKIKQLMFNKMSNIP